MVFAVPFDMPPSPRPPKARVNRSASHSAPTSSTVPPGHSRQAPKPMNDRTATETSSSPRTARFVVGASAPKGCLVGEGGRPLLSVTLDKKTDAVRSAFARLLKKTSIGGTFKMARKTSAGLLANSAWASLVDLFLGHAAAKLSDKHYAKAALGRLAQATSWLAKKYDV